MTTVQHQRRTYGGWIKGRDPGLPRLGWVGSWILFAGFILGIFSLLIGFWVGAGVWVTTLVVLAPLVWRDRWDRSLYRLGWEQWLWFAHRRGGRNIYLTGPLSPNPVTLTGQPGVAAALSVSQSCDVDGRPFVVLCHPKPGHVSIVLDLEPPGDDLLDMAVIDDQVALWGQWLGDLGYEDDFAQAQVVIETATDTGVEFRKAMGERVSPSASELALSVLDEVVDTWHRDEPRVRYRLVLTWRRKRSEWNAMIEDLSTRLPELLGSLAGTGCGVVRPLSADELAKSVRLAWGADLATVLDESTDGLLMADSGPLEYEERPGFLWHDGVLSRCWVMGAAASGSVSHDVLSSLTAPSSAVPLKRVTMLFRPYSAQDAASRIERDRRDILFEIGQKDLPDAKDQVELEAVSAAALDQVRSAGLVRFGIIVTATVDEHDKLERATAAIEQAGTVSRVRLRRAMRAQASTFVAGLPLGVVLPEHLAPIRRSPHGK